ncbi:ribose-phosphate pyrophosphokinase [Caldalkalibacillus thermarum TA2.A1]|uniref:Ribose-phosphate pyrophosphokinase n=1 Tax=Caldalkalibacillus thermarum (strain TA2.A1) TaxID=986075 RepID=F5L9Z0_CALTT|nr:ribose-phosphate diphosphokinase [Caldalkalibacillus thermarum]EGL81860.1 ribose-phosphate pyrophosphokinase [Caldalkalibacillus thermarum TA2.A1]QZT34347.1 ribose-phosphate diphosphokinase [Caldalkalibacillus thermarum TA2.A1]GGK32052.1 ribose-phosphate pyrophosphokinase [Caldalkalibacillus thermarum]
MPHYRDPKLKVFTCNANPRLAEAICKHIGVPLGKANVTRFSDGEIQVHINESVRGADVFVIQSTSAPVNEHLMELLVMVDALKRASAKSINVVMPYYGYARQDRKTRARDPITAKLVANLIETAGASRVITMDLHATQIQGFFDIPVDHLLGVPILADYFLAKNLDDIVVVSPDHGGVTRARKLAERLKAPIAIIDKRRPKPNVAEIMNIVGAVEGKTCILIDDIIDTAGTITLAANALAENGAQEVYACCTHPVLSGPAIERIQNSKIKELVVTDTIPLPEEKQIDKAIVLSVAPLMGEAIIRVHEELSVSKLFN